MTPWKLVVIVAGIAVWSSAAMAQQLVPSPKTHRAPAEIAAKSQLSAEKNESCRLEAKRRKLHLLKRRRFMRDCVKN